MTGEIINYPPSNWSPKPELLNVDDAAGAIIDLEVKPATDAANRQSSPATTTVGPPLELLTVKPPSTTKNKSPKEPPLPIKCPGCRTTHRPGRGETLCPPCHLKGRFDALVGEGKLASAAWESIRRTLCLPTDIEDLSAKQARAAILLLDAFVKRYSFNDQIAMTREAVIAALLVLPAFPPSFVKPLKAAAALAGLDNPKRKPVSVNKFAAVAARQGSFCFWCGIRVVREAEIPQANRLARNHSTVVYLSKDGELREETLGTIDHLVRVTDGGDNSLANLVISCAACNLKRDQITTAHNRPFARQHASCPDCGGRFFHPGWGCCSVCGAVIKQPAGFSDLLGDFIKALIKIVKSRYEK